MEQDTPVCPVFSVFGQGLHEGKHNTFKQRLKLQLLTSQKCRNVLSFLVSFTITKMPVVVWPSEGSLTQLLPSLPESS